MSIPTVIAMISAIVPLFLSIHCIATRAMHKHLDRPTIHEAGLVKSTMATSATPTGGKGYTFTSILIPQKEMEIQIQHWYLMDTKSTNWNSTAIRRILTLLFLLYISLCPKDSIGGAKAANLNVGSPESTRFTHPLGSP